MSYDAASSVASRSGMQACGTIFIARSDDIKHGITLSSCRVYLVLTSSTSGSSRCQELFLGVVTRVWHEGVLYSAWRKTLQWLPLGWRSSSLLGEISKSCVGDFRWPTYFCSPILVRIPSCETAFCNVREFEFHACRDCRERRNFCPRPQTPVGSYRNPSVSGNIGL